MRFSAQKIKTAKTTNCECWFHGNKTVCRDSRTTSMIQSKTFHKGIVRNFSCFRTRFCMDCLTGTEQHQQQSRQRKVTENAEVHWIVVLAATCKQPPPRRVSETQSKILDVLKQEVTLNCVLSTIKVWIKKAPKHLPVCIKTVDRNGSRFCIVVLSGSVVLLILPKVAFSCFSFFDTLSGNNEHRPVLCGLWSMILQICFVIFCEICQRNRNPAVWCVLVEHLSTGRLLLFSQWGEHIHYFQPTYKPCDRAPRKEFPKHICPRNCTIPFHCSLFHNLNEPNEGANSIFEIKQFWNRDRMVEWCDEYSYVPESIATN